MSSSLVSSNNKKSTKYDDSKDELILHATPSFGAVKLLGQTIDPYLKSPRDILRGVYDEFMYVLHFHVLGTLIASMKHKNPISFNIQNELIEVQASTSSSSSRNTSSTTTIKTTTDSATTTTKTTTTTGSSSTTNQTTNPNGSNSKHSFTSTIGPAYNMPVLKRKYGTSGAKSISLRFLQKSQEKKVFLSNNNGGRRKKNNNYRKKQNISYYTLDRAKSGMMWQNLLEFEHSVHSQEARYLLSHITSLNSKFVRLPYYSRKFDVAKLAKELHHFSCYMNHRNFLTLLEPTKLLWKHAKLIIDKIILFCEQCLVQRSIREIRPDLAMASQRHVKQIKRLKRVLIYMEPQSLDSNRSMFRHKFSSVMDSLSRINAALDNDLNFDDDDEKKSRIKHVSDLSRFACISLASRLSYWKAGGTNFTKRNPVSNKKEVKKPRKKNNKRKFSHIQNETFKHNMFKACSGVRHEYDGVSTHNINSKYFRNYTPLKDSTNGILKPVTYDIYDPTGKTHVDMLNHGLDLLALYFRELLKTGIEDIFDSESNSDGPVQLLKIFMSSPPYDLLVPLDIDGIEIWSRPNNEERYKIWEPISAFELHQKVSLKNVSTSATVQSLKDIIESVKCGKLSKKVGERILNSFIQDSPLSNDPRCK